VRWRAIGGFVLDAAKFPAGWLAGAMLFAAVAALSGRPIYVPQPLARAFFIILGLSIGGVVTPETVKGMATWPFSLFMVSSHRHLGTPRPAAMATAKNIADAAPARARNGLRGGEIVGVLLRCLCGLHRRHRHRGRGRPPPELTAAVAACLARAERQRRPRLRQSRPSPVTHSFVRHAAVDPAGSKARPLAFQAGMALSQPRGAVPPIVPSRALGEALRLRFGVMRRGPLGLGHLGRTKGLPDGGFRPELWHFAQRRDRSRGRV
jgi:hypothetical protein